MSVTMEMAQWVLVLLLGAVVLVNGWTDAPNAIATVVASETLSFRRAAALAAVCNLLGTAAAARWLPAVTSRGVREPFRTGCHCFAKSGQVVAKSFSSCTTARLAHTGQPQPAVLAFTRAIHSCPFSQRHQTTL